MGGLLLLDRTGDWITEKREKLSNKISNYRERRRLKQLTAKKDANGDENDETAVLVQHSRIDWTPSDIPSLNHGRLRSSGSQSTLAPPLAGFAGRNSSFSVLSSSTRPSHTISTQSQSSSPGSRQLRPHTRNYAHTAWTPPDETFDADDEVYQRACVRYVEKAASEGRFDSEAINSRFDSFYRNRSSPDLQVYASSEFRRRSEAKSEKRKLQFELMNRRAASSQHSSESRLVTSKPEYQLDFHSDVSRSSFGDIVGEVMRRSGGVNGM